MTTVLELIQGVTNEIPSILTPTTIVGNTDKTVIQYKALLEKAGKRLARFGTWVELRKEHTFDLVDSQESYPFPADMDRPVDGTVWDRTHNWRLIGHLNPREWQVEKSGIVSSGVRYRFTIKGSADNQFYISPIPGTGDAGTTLVYEYITRNWVRPRTWVTGTSYTSGDYVWYNGNIYTAGSTATSGATPPTHTSGVVSDGAINWTYYDGIYESVVRDDDVIVLDADLLDLSLIWRFMRANTLPGWQDYKQEADYEINKRKSALTPSRMLNMASRGVSKLINNFPDTITGV